MLKKPIQSFHIWNVPKASQEQQCIGNAPVRFERIAGSVDARAQSSLHDGLQLRKKACQILFVRLATHLNAIHFRQHLQFIFQGTQILKSRRSKFQRVPDFLNRTADGLKVHIMFKQNAGNVFKAPGVLTHVGIFNLENIHLIYKDFAINQPIQITISKLTHSIGFNTAQLPDAPGHPH